MHAAASLHGDSAACSPTTCHIFTRRSVATRFCSTCTRSLLPGLSVLASRPPRLLERQPTIAHRRAGYSSTLDGGDHLTWSGRDGRRVALAPTVERTTGAAVVPDLGLCFCFNNTSRGCPPGASHLVQNTGGCRVPCVHRGGPVHPHRHALSELRTNSATQTFVLRRKEGQGDLKAPRQAAAGFEGASS